MHETDQAKKQPRLKMQNYFSIASYLLGVMLVCAMLSGCDVGTYGKRYNDRIGKMTSMANTNKDLANDLIDIAGVAKIRIPRVCYNEDSVKYGKQDEFLKARIPGIEIEGFVSSFMGDKEGNDGKWYPFQVYFYYIPNKNVEEVKKDVKAAFAEKLSSTTISWDSMNVETYDGNEYAWSATTIGAGQQFLVYENNSEKAVELNGKIEVFATSNDQGVLLVIFRAPTSVFGDGEKSLLDGTLKSIQGFK